MSPDPADGAPGVNAAPVAVPVPEAAPALGVEDLLTALLRSGVWACFLLVSFGMALSFVNHPEYASSSQELQALLNQPAPRSLAEILASASSAHGRGFVMLGLLVMIATPVFRVGLSLMAFRQQRDRPFTVICATLLALLAFSFWLGRGHGG